MRVPDHTLLAAPYLKYGHQLGDMCSPVEIADHFLTYNTLIWIYWLSLLAGGHGTKESKILHSVDCIEKHWFQYTAVSYGHAWLVYITVIDITHLVQGHC